MRQHRIRQEMVRAFSLLAARPAQHLLPRTMSI
jgi:hypothetical protein